MSTNINVNCVRQLDSLLPTFHAGNRQRRRRRNRGGRPGGGSTEVKENTSRQPGRGQSQTDADETLHQNAISLWDSFMLPVGVVKYQRRTHTLIHRHARSPACDHTVSRVHQSVLPSIRESIKERCVVSLHLLRSSR